MAVTAREHEAHQRVGSDSLGAGRMQDRSALRVIVDAKAPGAHRNAAMAFDGSKVTFQAK